ncbi:hypothetical protein C8R45DRAFT_945415 [Mycena sanguinolenta]|nr:hypothetical protein C8R45DRAFT_945415 [Mycena sanguinolenta]
MSSNYCVPSNLDPVDHSLAITAPPVPLPTTALRATHALDMPPLLSALPLDATPTFDTAPPLYAPSTVAHSHPSPPSTVCLIILLVHFGLFLIAPLQEHIIGHQFHFRRSSMVWTDKRAANLANARSQVLEVLAFMRVVNYFCHKIFFLARIAAIRGTEMHWIRECETVFPSVAQQNSKATASLVENDLFRADNILWRLV